MIIPFLVLLLSGFAAATPDSLSLEDCLALARESNPRSRLSANSILGWDLSRQELKARNRPQVKFKGIFEYAPVGKYYGYDPGLTNGGQLGSQIAVEQTVYDGGITGIKSRQADLGWSRSNHEQKLAGLDLEYDVTQAFTEVLRLQEDSALKQTGLARLREYSGLVERMHAGGQAGYTDLLKTRIHVSESESAAKLTNADLESAKYALAELIGLEPSASIQVKGELDAPFDPMPLDTTVNADWKIAELETQIADLDVAAARSEWKPTLSVAADIGLLTSIDNLKAAPQDRANMLGASVGMHLDMPIFSWGLAKTHLLQSRLAVENARWQWRAHRRELLFGYRKALMQWEAARDHLSGLRADLTAAKDNFDLTKAKYAGGSGLASEVLDAHQLWVETQASLLQARADLRNLGARLKRLEAR